MDDVEKWILFMSVLFVIFIGTVVTMAIMDENEDQKDCVDRNGTFLEGGKYGDNACVVDGRIVKVY